MENKGVEPLTFPMNREPLAPIGYNPVILFKYLLFLLHFCNLVENKGVEPLTFPMNRDALAPIGYNPVILF